MTTKINVVFCVNNEYAKYLRVTIKSLLDNNKIPISLHIIGNNISRWNKYVLKNIISKYDFVDLNFYSIDCSVLNGLYTGKWSIETWFRILIPDILPFEIKKVLYLDADTVILGNVTELYHINMENYSIAGALDDQSYDRKLYKRLNYNYELSYICCGVLLINLEFWRKNNIKQKIIDYAINHRHSLILPDQDSINFVCSHTKKIIPLKYNLLQNYYNYKNFFRNHCHEELKAALNSPVIIHYGGGLLPWIRDIQHHIYTNEWLKYNQKLPYPVKLRYRTKGFLLIKIMLYDLFHSNKRIIEIDKEFTKYIVNELS